MTTHTTYRVYGPWSSGIREHRLVGFAERPNLRPAPEPEDPEYKIYESSREEWMRLRDTVQSPRLIGIISDRQNGKEQEVPHGKIYNLGDTRGRYENGHKFREICVKAGTKATSEWMVLEGSIETIEDMRARLRATQDALSAEKKERARADKERWRHIDLLQSDPLYRRTYETRQRLAERFGGTAADYGRIDTKPKDAYFDRTGTDREWARRNSPPPRVSVEETVVTSSAPSSGSSHVAVPERREAPAEGSSVEFVTFDKDDQAVLDRVNQELKLDTEITIKKTEENGAVLYVDRATWGLSNDGFGGIRIPANTLTVTVIGPDKYALTGTGVAGTFERNGDSLILDLHSSTKDYRAEWRRRVADAPVAAAETEKKDASATSASTREKTPAKPETPTEKTEDPMLRAVAIDAQLVSTQEQMKATGKEWVTIENGLQGFEYTANSDGFFAKNIKGGEVYKVNPLTLETVLVKKSEKKPSAFVEKAKEIFRSLSKQAREQAQLE